MAQVAPGLMAKARRALRAAKQFQDLKDLLEGLKPAFRDHGESIAVPGLGTVTFSKGSAARTVDATDKLVFKEEAYKALPEDMRNQLTKLGVVVTETVPEQTIAAGTPSIGFKVNV